jgi:UDP-N-acetylmuramate--alanine ligase
VTDRMNISLDQFDKAYFIGIGGIGMSALARYFHHLGWSVAGYDKTPSDLTKELESEGIAIHFEDSGPSVSPEFMEKESTLVVYTPAVPKNHGELLHFQHHEAQIYKRSEVLGLLTRNSKAIGVAGTHGKTTTSSMLAHVLNGSSVKCNAFLGGIATNFNSNLVLEANTDVTVIEADEFDRSFLRLRPFATIITSTDPDHLDIYGDASYFKEGFQLYADLVDEKGLTVMHASLDLQPKGKVIRYGVNFEGADLIGHNLRVEDGFFRMDVSWKDETWKNVVLGIPGIHNAENALAVIAMSLFMGAQEAEIREGLKTFLGVKRRFEYRVRKNQLIYIDDYAHHPTELKALIDSVRMLYPEEKITGVFQPHLFSRTRDFFDGFAMELSRLDEVILMPIYPAREEPIPGVSSEVLFDAIQANEKILLPHAEVIDRLNHRDTGVILTIGAGDIDRIVEPLTQLLS